MGVFDALFRRSRRVTEEAVTVELDRPRPEGLVLRAANLQGIGRREDQEDSFALLNASNAEELARRGLFAVVADGMGGMADGKAASEGAVDGFLQLFQALRDEGDVPRQLREGVCAVSDGLFQRFGGRSGTTAVAVRIFQNTLHWVSVGDSALFLARGGGVFQLNREHTYLNRLYLRELGDSPIRKDRAEQDIDARRLTSFVGIDHLTEVDQSLRPLPLQPGDTLLLCSDGISGVLTPPELAEAMTLEPDEGCTLLETMLREKNLDQQDNYTGILISCQESVRERRK